MFSQLVYSEGTVGEGNLILHDHCIISQSQNTKVIVVNDYSPIHKKVAFVFFCLFFTLNVTHSYMYREDTCDV